ncbi:MAG: hypothetical protein OXC48_10455 [Endozoicomonadaceae bacterium]|nr:hypothetical protein [Endozoicomonadaceae bacterium]
MKCLSVIKILLLFVGACCHAQSVDPLILACTQNLEQLKAVINQEGSLIHYGSGCALVMSFAGLATFKQGQCYATGYYDGSFGGTIKYAVKWSPNEWKHAIFCSVIK